MAGDGVPLGILNSDQTSCWSMTSKVKDTIRSTGSWAELFCLKPRTSNSLPETQHLTSMQASAEAAVDQTDEQVSLGPLQNEGLSAVDKEIPQTFHSEPSEEQHNSTFQCQVCGNIDRKKENPGCSVCMLRNLGKETNKWYCVDEIGLPGMNVSRRVSGSVGMSLPVVICVDASDAQFVGSDKLVEQESHCYRTDVVFSRRASLGHDIRKIQVVHSERCARLNKLCHVLQMAGSSEVCIINSNPKNDCSEMTLELPPDSQQQEQTTNDLSPSVTGWHGSSYKGPDAQLPETPTEIRERNKSPSISSIANLSQRINAESEKTDDNRNPGCRDYSQPELPDDSLWPGMQSRRDWSAVCSLGNDSEDQVTMVENGMGICDNSQILQNELLLVNQNNYIADKILVERECTQRSGSPLMCMSSSLDAFTGTERTRLFKAPASENSFKIVPSFQEIASSDDGPPDSVEQIAVIADRRSSDSSSLQDCICIHPTVSCHNVEGINQTDSLDKDHFPAISVNSIEKLRYKNVSKTGSDETAESSVDSVFVNNTALIGKFLHANAANKTAEPMNHESQEDIDSSLVSSSVGASDIDKHILSSTTNFHLFADVSVAETSAVAPENPPNIASGTSGDRINSMDAASSVTAPTTSVPFLLDVLNTSAGNGRPAVKKNVDKMLQPKHHFWKKSLFYVQPLPKSYQKGALSRRKRHRGIRHSSSTTHRRRGTRFGRTSMKRRMANRQKSSLHLFMPESTFSDSPITISSCQPMPCEKADINFSESTSSVTDIARDQNDLAYTLEAPNNLPEKTDAVSCSPVVDKAEQAPACTLSAERGCNITDDQVSSTHSSPTESESLSVRLDQSAVENCHEDKMAANVMLAELTNRSTSDPIKDLEIGSSSANSREKFSEAPETFSNRNTGGSIMRIKGAKRKVKPYKKRTKKRDKPPVKRMKREPDITKGNAKNCMYLPYDVVAQSMKSLVIRLYRCDAEVTNVGAIHCIQGIKVHSSDLISAKNVLSKATWSESEARHFQGKSFQRLSGKPQHENTRVQAKTKSDGSVPDELFCPKRSLPKTAARKYNKRKGNQSIIEPLKELGPLKRGRKSINQTNKMQLKQMPKTKTKKRKRDLVNHSDLPSVLTWPSRLPDTVSADYTVTSEGSLQPMIRDDPSAAADVISTSPNRTASRSDGPMVTEVNLTPRLVCISLLKNDIIESKALTTSAIVNNQAPKLPKPRGRPKRRHKHCPKRWSGPVHVSSKTSSVSHSQNVRDYISDNARFPEATSVNASVEIPLLRWKIADYNFSKDCGSSPLTSGAASDFKPSVSSVCLQNGRSESCSTSAGSKLLRTSPEGGGAGPNFGDLHSTSSCTSINTSGSGSIRAFDRNVFTYFDSAVYSNGY